MCTRHPDLNSIRALATVSVWLVNCNSLLSPFFDEEIVKPTRGVGLTTAFWLGGLSKTVLGLGILPIEILEAAAIAASSSLSAFTGGCSAVASAGTSGRTAARCFVSLNHSTQPPQKHRKCCAVLDRRLDCHEI